MRVLVVDTATPAVTTAVVAIDGPAAVTPVAERSTVDERAHGELLAPAITAVLAEAGLGPRDLTAIVAGVGPGPFTGLRVGLVTAVAMGQALAIPTYGVCSLDALGAATPGGRGVPGAPGGRGVPGASGAPGAPGAPDRTGAVLVATDARRREIYWAIYRDGVALTPPAVDRPARVAELLADHGVDSALGDGAHRYADVLGVAVLDAPRYPPAVALARLAADRVLGRAPSEILTPLYLRRPDAAEPHPPKAVSV